jgi:hypothetical protein
MEATTRKVDHIRLGDRIEVICHYLLPFIGCSLISFIPGWASSFCCRDEYGPYGGLFSASSTKSDARPSSHYVTEGSNEINQTVSSRFTMTFSGEEIVTPLPFYHSILTDTSLFIMEMACYTCNQYDVTFHDPHL